MAINPCRGRDRSTGRRSWTSKDVCWRRRCRRGYERIPFTTEKHEGPDAARAADICRHHLAQVGCRWTRSVVQSF
jgi:hypothetical protein